MCHIVSYSLLGFGNGFGFSCGFACARLRCLRLFFHIRLFRLQFTLLARFHLRLVLIRNGVVLVTLLVVYGDDAWGVEFKTLAIVDEQLVLLATRGFLDDKTRVLDIVEAVGTAPRVEDFLGCAVGAEVGGFGRRIFLFVDCAVTDALVVPRGVLDFDEAVGAVGDSFDVDSVDRHDG